MHLRPQVGQALCLGGELAGLAQRGDKYRDQQRDDGDDYQQLDQREGHAAAAVFGHCGILQVLASGLSASIVAAQPGGPARQTAPGRSKVRTPPSAAA
jgi:hypothetical protein